ncbi:polar amino acid transport system substrate-binding protein [Oceanicella actignis]|nr:polar amino acid transport system substrate-binding protein [Oceanicella actignis]
MKRFMKHFAAAAMAAGVACGAMAQEGAPARECGVEYVVVPGDTLGVIARKTLGDERLFDLIHLVNRAAIGPDPNRIEIGQRLRIPCPDDLLAARVQLDEAADGASAAPASVPASDPAADPAADPAGALAADPLPAPALRREVPGAPLLRLVTFDRNPPLSGADLPAGGVLTDLVGAALSVGRPAFGYEVVFVDDPAAMRGPQARADLHFPAVAPDCAAGASLPPAARARCAAELFSDPFFEIRVGYFVGPRSDYRRAKAPADLRGLRLCRPARMPVGDLEARGLTDPEVSLVRGRDLDYCLRALRIGEVDVVSAETVRVNEAAERLGYVNWAVELEPLSQTLPLRAAGPRTARTRRALEALDAGLARLRSDGGWFRIVSRHATGAAATN